MKKILSEIHRKNISLARLKRKERLGYINSPKTRESLSKKTRENAKVNPNFGFKGKHHSESTKEKLRIARAKQVGVNHPFYGRHHSEETKKKISLKKKGQKLSLSTRLKMALRTKERNPFYGKYHTEETKEKMREKRALQIAPVKDTKIEIKIRNFLDLLKVEYFQHKHMNIEHSYQCDFFIPSMNLVIECDGMYWHKYPIGREIDCVRTKELIEKGFKVLRLWESEINNMDINLFKESLGIEGSE